MASRQELKQRAKAYVKLHHAMHPPHKLKRQLIKHNYPPDLVQEVLDDHFFEDHVWKYRGIVLLTFIMIFIAMFWLAYWLN